MISRETMHLAVNRALRRQQLAAVAAAAASVARSRSRRPVRPPEASSVSLLLRKAELACRRRGHAGDILGKFACRASFRSVRRQPAVLRSRRRTKPRRQQTEDARQLNASADSDEDDDASEPANGACAEHKRNVKLGTPEERSKLGLSANVFPQRLPPKHDPLKAKEVSWRQLKRYIAKDNGFFVARAGQRGGNSGTFKLKADDIAKEKCGKRRGKFDKRDSNERHRELYSNLFELQDAFSACTQQNKSNVLFFDGMYRYLFVLTFSQNCIRWIQSCISRFWCDGQSE